MLHILFKCLLWAGLVWVVTMVAINAAYMLVSPKAWFALPSWLRGQGGTTRDRDEAGFGALQLRLTGAIILGVLAWAIYSVMTHGQIQGGTSVASGGWSRWVASEPRMVAIVSQWAPRALAAVVLLLGAINGISMLLGPAAWLAVPNWLRSPGSANKTEYETRAAVIQLRATGAMLLAGALWLAYDMWNRWYR